LRPAPRPDVIPDFEDYCSFLDIYDLARATPAPA
jgi:hypothetical protein